MYLLISCVYIHIICVLCINNRSLTEIDLQTTLFKEYFPYVMPLDTTSHKMDITMEMRLLSIEAVDELKQTFSVRAFLEVRWKDSFLTWNPKAYGGVRQINIPNEQIWKPDLALQDTYDSLTDLGQKDGRALVDHNGSILMWPYKIYTVGCKIKVRYFPFDVQTCEMDFLSWTNPVTVLDFKTTEGEMSRDRYNENGEWWLETSHATNYYQEYGDDAWAHVKFTFTLRRKWLYYALNIIGPILCISLLNIVCFVVPAASGEKVTLCISTFLTLAVFLTMITNTLPASSDELSTLEWYVGLQLLASGLTIVCTVASLCFYTRESSEPMSTVVRYLCKFLGNKRKRKCAAHSANPTLNERKMSTISAAMMCIHESDVDWVMASYAFDRLCMWIAISFHICLTVTLVSVYLEE